MEDLIKAVKSLLSDIEAMRCIADEENDSGQWFGEFSEHRICEYWSGPGTVVVEWPNLAISAADVKVALAALDGPIVEGELAQKGTCSICFTPQFETPSGTACKNGHGGAEPMRLMGT